MKYCLLLGFLLAALASWNKPLQDPAGTHLLKVAAAQLYTLPAGDVEGRLAADMDDPSFPNAGELLILYVFFAPAAPHVPRLFQVTTTSYAIRAPPPGDPA